ncbi:MAG: transcription antitermination factor NusB [Fusobacteria bacterium]|nr:MAG: transcription antitermination factor NusB [Fusobacteriota bacterium]
MGERLASRKIAREELFKLLFEADMNKVTPLKRLDEFLSDGNRRTELVSKNNDNTNNVEEIELLEEEIKFIRKFAEGIDKHYGTIDAELNEKMEDWSLETIGNVERSLLRFGVYELLYEDTGFEIVLNEIIELAKTYGDTSSHEFVNGVLAKFVKK